MFDHVSDYFHFHSFMLHAYGFCRDAVYTDSLKIGRIKGNRTCRKGEIRRNPATIALAKFFHGFDRF